MRKDSQFLAKLNDEARPYEVVPYVRLGDLVIGAENAAPPGQTPFWLSRAWFGSHALAGCDRRILADIARRLRQEQPFTLPPAAPLPGGSATAAPPPSLSSDDRCIPIFSASGSRLLNV